MKDSLAQPEMPPLLRAVFHVLQAHRAAARQARLSWRAVGCV